MAVSLQKTINGWVQIGRGVPITRIEAANLVLPVMADFITSKPKTQKMSEDARQKSMMKQLDLSGLKGWEKDLGTKVV